MAIENTIQPVNKVAKIWKDLDLNFAPNQKSGVAKKTDGNAVKQSMRILILTNFYERPFYPTKGGNVRGMLFENMTPLVASAMQKGMENLITSYEPRVELESVEVIPNYDQNSYEVTIRYSILNVNKPDSLSLELKRLR